jgi:hypothetical protein
MKNVIDDFFDCICKDINRIYLFSILSFLLGILAGTIILKIFFKIN